MFARLTRYQKPGSIHRQSTLPFSAFRNLPMICSAVCRVIAIFDLLPMYPIDHNTTAAVGLVAGSQVNGLNDIARGYGQCLEKRAHVDYVVLGGQKPRKVSS